MRACVRACVHVRACVRACVCTCVRACVRVPWVGVEIEQILLAARGLQPAHAARPLVKGHPLLARVAAIDALHVPVLRQVGRALVLADDVHAVMRAAPCSAAVGRQSGGVAGRGRGGAEDGRGGHEERAARRGAGSPRPAQREPLQHCRGLLSQHARDAVGRHVLRRESCARWGQEQMRARAAWAA